MSRRIAVALWVALPLLGLGAILLLTRPDPSSTPAPVDLRAYDDATEDAVMEVEEMLLDLVSQLRRRAWGGAMYHIAEDFEGGPLFREAEGEPKVVGGVAFRTAGPDARRVDRAGFRKALEEVRIEDGVFKLPSAALQENRLVAKLKLDAWRPGRRWVLQGDAEFVNRGSRWQLRRWSGTGAATEEGEVRFPDATAALGLALPPAEDVQAGTRVTFGRLFIGGIAAGDADGDGDDDLYVPQVGPDAFFRNEGGRFVEAAAEFGAHDPDAGAGALFLDADNDGDLDLLVTNYEPAELRDRRTGELRPNGGRRALALYRNEGGRFSDVTEQAGLRSMGPAMSACAADIDRDGDLDVYVCMYKDDAKDDPRFSEEVPKDVFGARDGVANQLWINRGDGTFAEEGAKRGVADTGWSLAAGFSDFDGDGDADLYLANDYGDNRLFRNKGDGTFEDATAAARAADTGFGMGVAWFDFDGDGDLDLYVSNMYSTAGNRILARGAPDPRLLKMARGNTMLRNRGDGTFEDATAETATGRAGWAWSAAEFDYDNDGRPDLYVANGFRTSGFATSDL